MATEVTYSGSTCHVSSDDPTILEYLEGLPHLPSEIDPRGSEPWAIPDSDGGGFEVSRSAADRCRELRGDPKVSNGHNRPTLYPKPPDEIRRDLRS